MSVANILPQLSGVAINGQTTLNAGASPAITIPYIKSTDVVILQPISTGVASATAGELGCVVANSGLVNATLTIQSQLNTDVRVVNYLVWTTG